MKNNITLSLQNNAIDDYAVYSTWFQTNIKERKKVYSLKLIQLIILQCIKHDLKLICKDKKHCISKITQLMTTQSIKHGFKLK